MPTAWRIVKQRHAEEAFDGEGAKMYGGRWNSPGVAVTYAPESRALATLEVLAGLQTNSPLPGYVLIPAEFDDSLVVAVEVEELPVNWRKNPPPPATRRIGDDWITGGESAVLRVPSALVPQESNYLLNPRHPAFSEVRIERPEGLAMDPRLIRTSVSHR
jgi:RES domain-containing protein